MLELSKKLAYISRNGSLSKVGIAITFFKFSIPAEQLLAQFNYYDYKFKIFLNLLPMNSFTIASAS